MALKADYTRAERERIFRAVCVAVSCQSYTDLAPSYLVEKVGRANNTFRVWRHLDIPRRSKVLEYLRERGVFYDDIMEWINACTTSGKEAETLTHTVLVKGLRKVVKDD